MATVKEFSAPGSLRPFGFRDKFGYFLGDFGCNLSFALISGYMMLFFTQHIGVSLVHYGLIILFTKIWDGINDPIIGAIADRFNPRGGDKFRPWIFWGSFPLAIAACIMFIDTSSAPYWVKILICISGYMIWDIAYTIINVPYGSLNSTITANAVERSQLSTWRSFGGILASILLGVILPLLMYKKVTLENGSVVSQFQGQNMFAVALILGILALVCFQLLYRLVIERIKHTEHDGQKFNYFRTLKNFFANRTLLAVSLSVMSNLILIMSGLTTFSLVYQMYFNDGSLAVLGIVSILPIFVFAPLVKPLVKKYGKKALCSWPLLAGIAVNLALLIVPNVSVVLWVAGQIIASFSGGFYTLIGWALVSDGIDSMELETGRREEGSVYATYSMMRKIAQGVGQALIPFIIALALPGLDMKNQLTWNAAYGLQIKNLSVLLCLIGYILAFIIMHFLYDIDQKKEMELPALLGHSVKETDSAVDAVAKNISRRDE